MALILANWTEIKNRKAFIFAFSRLKDGFK